jgi:hypothetical protein
MIPISSTISSLSSFSSPFGLSLLSSPHQHSSRLSHRPFIRPFRERNRRHLGDFEPATVNGPQQSASSFRYHDLCATFLALIGYYSHHAENLLYRYGFSISAAPENSTLIIKHGVWGTGHGSEEKNSAPQGDATF